MGPFTLCSVQVDLDRRWVERAGVRKNLTSLEVAVLRYLLSAKRPVSRDELLTEVWGYTGAALTRTCDTTIRRLRTKIEDDPSNPTVILTVHGLGYHLVQPSRAEPNPIDPAPISHSRRYTLPDRTLDLDRLRVDTPLESHSLTGNEAILLEALIAAPGAALSQDALQRRIWGVAGGRRLYDTVRRVRRKLEPDPEHPQVLVTTARGYRIDLPALCPSPELKRRPLPAELDRRFGRSAEITEILGHFEAGDRLVTLTGLGGVGKTRLALAAALELEARGWQTVWVDASDARTLDALYALLAVALQVQLNRGDPLDALVEILRPERAPLLVLDNLEQLAHASVALGGLLTGIAALRILTTSRIGSGTRGERTLVVEPLPPPEATALFLDRAARRLLASEHELILELVTELEGLPLAVELAAARTRTLSVTQIRARTGEALKLLATGLGRYGSLRASLDGSWELLSPDGQAALAELTVFAGPFSRDAALAVLDPGPERWPVDVVQELFDAGLLRFDGQTFSLFEVVREYASEHLDPVARHAAELRHGAVYAAPIPTGGELLLDALQGPRRQELLSRIERDLPNLRAALGRAIERHDPGTAVGVLRTAWQIWSIHGPFAVIARDVDRVLALQLDPAQRAEIDLIAGALRTDLGAPTDAEKHLHTARALAAEADAPLIETQAVLTLWRLYFQHARYAEGRAVLEDARELAQRARSWSLSCQTLIATAGMHLIHDPDQIPGILAEAESIAVKHDATSLAVKISNRLGTYFVQQGRIDEAVRSMERGRRFGSADLNSSEEAVGLNIRGGLHLYRGEVTEALAAWLAAEVAHRRIGNRIPRGLVLCQIGEVRLSLGQFEAAEAALLRGLEQLRACGSRIGECGALNGLGELAALRTDRVWSGVEVSIGWFCQALQVALDLGDQRREALSRERLGWMLCVSGASEEGLRELSRAAATMAEIGDHLHRSLQLVLIGAQLADLDRLKEAYEHAEPARAYGAQHGFVQLREQADLLLAALDARLGRLGSAEQRLAELRAVAGARDLQFRARLALAVAELAHARGAWEERRAALEDAARVVNAATLGARYRTLASARS